MGFWSRLSTLFRSNANAAMESLEDPSKMLNQAVVDMKVNLKEARKAAAVAIASEKLAKKEYEQAAKKAEEWNSKAMMALRAGEEDLARKALQKKREVEAEVEVHKASWTQQEAACKQLKAKLLDLQDGIEKAERKKALLLSKVKQAEAQKQINQAMSSFNVGDDGIFDRMETKIERGLAESEAVLELSAGKSQGAVLEEQFAALEAGAGVDDELAAMKAQMALGAAERPVEALPVAESAPNGEAEDELAALKAQLAEETKG